jgi:hypothetical protein
MVQASALSSNRSVAIDFMATDRLRQPRPVGAVRVTATIGTTTWQTSVFPEKSDAYVLPVRKPVRTAENLVLGENAQVELEIVDERLLD